MSDRIKAAIGLALSLGAALALTRFGAPPKAALETRLSYEAAWWGAAAVTMLYALIAERKPVASIGLRKPSWRDIAIGGGAGLLIVAGTIFVYMTLFPVLLLSISMSHIPNIVEMPYWYRLVMVLRIALVGELLFRAYAVERMEELGLSGWIAGAISLAAFIAANWSGWNPVESITMVFSGAALTGLYMWRRNLYVNMIARFAALGAGYLLRERAVCQFSSLRLGMSRKSRSFAVTSVERVLIACAAIMRSKSRPFAQPSTAMIRP